MSEQGKLYICGTPIGNLQDITLRTLDILKKVDLIAAEDTRRTAKLLNNYEIETSLTSYHEHNEKEKSRELILKLEMGQDLALVSDAGMPGISDPGAVIINKAIAKNIEVVPIPGPTALISALIVSCLPMDKFVFDGFIPRKGEEREKCFRNLEKQTRTTILYESPYRLKNTLQDLRLILQTRKIVVVRELTKFHEEKIYGTVTQVLEKLKDRDIKGEIVLVVAGREKNEIEEEGWEDLSIIEHVELLMENGYTKKESIKNVAKLRDLPKSKVYKKAIVINARQRK
jgi:16S rRNA (cytidine1402-2'-O)-methyltransferase